MEVQVERPRFQETRPVVSRRNVGGGHRGGRVRRRGHVRTLSLTASLLTGG